MSLLTPERSADASVVPDPSVSTSERTLRLVPFGSSSIQRHPSKWLVLVGVVGAFLGGFGISSYWRPLPSVLEPKIQIADFRVPVPEGDTTIVITSREGNAQELARLEIHRQGSEIVGLPAETGRIEPREKLSADDANFLRHELAAVVLPSDSAWDETNKIRSWLARQPHRLGMPGLTTRRGREAYQQMKLGSSSVGRCREREWLFGCAV